MSELALGSAPRTESQARSVAAPATRRRFVQSLVGGVLAASLPLVMTPSVGARQAVFAPADLSIPGIDLAAEIEQVYIVDGVMQAPGDPWKVGWYSQLAFPGQGANVVMAGHKDFWNVGPAVFQDLAALEPGESILLHDRQGDERRYDIVEVGERSAATPPSEYTTGDGRESLTLITCAGTFDGAGYTDRLIVRAIAA